MLILTSLQQQQQQHIVTAGEIWKIYTMVERLHFIASSADGHSGVNHKSFGS
jgi:hypothetical protein